MTNSTSTDVTDDGSIFSAGGARCNRAVAKQKDSQSAAPADKQLNIHPPASVIHLKLLCMLLLILLHLLLHIL